MLSNILLLIYNYASMIAARSDGKQQNCENNLFSGNWQPINTINYYITRAISNFSANVAALVLFWKVRVEQKAFGSYRNKSEAEKVIIGFMMNADNEQLVPMDQNEVLFGNLSNTDQGSPKSHMSSQMPDVMDQLQLEENYQALQQMQN